MSSASSRKPKITGWIGGKQVNTKHTLVSRNQFDISWNAVLVIKRSFAKQKQGLAFDSKVVL